jgi:hypothetical protein
MEVANTLAYYDTVTMTAPLVLQCGHLVPVIVAGLKP